MSLLAEPCPNLELLSAYIDEAVTPVERALIEAHLDGCFRCLDLVSVVIATKITVLSPLSSGAKSS